MITAADADASPEICARRSNSTGAVG